MIIKEALILMDQIQKLKYEPNDQEKRFMKGIISLAKAKGIKVALTYKQSNFMSAIYRNAASGRNYQQKQYI